MTFVLAVCDKRMLDFTALLFGAAITAVIVFAILATWNVKYEDGDNEIKLIAQEAKMFPLHVAVLAGTFALLGYATMEFALNLIAADRV